ncbi:hypothetical protein SESBI_29686 [Sesbania bispinosa]|nr:hypothetical protein SESBI_29686 [Sesbania bispinosa]
MAMEADNWSSETNWTIASGSLRNCLTFQSSLSFSDDDGPSTSNSSPLILHSPSLDSAPCEIKINFAEKHELRQVYVRSTARVYEIYCAPDLQSNNEYLCTVRCGAAVRDGEVLRSPSTQEIASLPNKDLGEENIKNEDDWVEVKVVDTPPQTKPYIDSTRTTQDLFEATAEINDTDPCISVTLRLLSLQSKGCVYVDEIYVFGDPVDSESRESCSENSSGPSGNSLMAMFLPTLMQFSKTTGLNHLNAVRKEKQFVSKDDLEETPHPSDSVIKTQLEGKAGITDPQEVELREVKGGWVGASQPDTSASKPSQPAQMDGNCSVVPSKIAEMENNHSAVSSQAAAVSGSNQGVFSGANVERALEQLVSRMDRLEEICLGFQEKMVMPVNSIEARLQQVEQQLDILTKKLQNSALPSCYRISAPDASCIESDANSCDNCLGDTVAREIQSDKKYLHTEVLNASPHDMSDSENYTQLLPALVVTAPEFPDGEDEEDNASRQEMNSSTDKGKQSIDDALSSALANFLSSLSLESSKYTKSLIKAPEFSNEDDDDHESNDETAKNDSDHLTVREKFNHIQVLASSNISLESGEKANGDSNDKHAEKTAQEAEEHGQFCSREGDQDEECVKASILAEHNSRTGFNDKVEEDKNGKINGQKSDGLSSNMSDISNELLDNQAPAGYSITQEGPSARTEVTVATEVPKKTFHENIIENVLGFSLSSSAVDFEVPLLDVKFISQRSPVTEGFLEALVIETPETSARDLSIQESSGELFVKEQLRGNGDLSGEEQSNLISVDDGELVNPASENHFALNEDLCTSKSAPVNIEGDNLPEDQISTSLI